MVGVLQILGGLALFMFGIRMLSAGMEKLAGEQIQKWMDRVTNGRLRSAAFGAVATALIQSSGLETRDSILRRANDGLVAHVKRGVDHHSCPGKFLELAD